MGSLSNENPQGAKILAVSFLFLGIAIAAVGLRFWSRKITKASLCLNDYAILAALLFSIALMGILTATVVETGLGQHVYNLRLEQITTLSKLELAFSTVWIFSITAVKVSILDLYIKIFRLRWFVKVCWCFIAFQLVFCACVLLEIYLICRPVSLNWDLTGAGTCGSRSNAYLSQHIIILFIDISIAVLPVPVLWRLQMPMSRKMSISLLFSLGAIICVISLLRIIWVKKVNGTDITYSWALLYLFSVLEPLLGILLACLPLIQPVRLKIIESALMGWIGSKISSTLGSSSSRNKASSGSSNPKNFDRLPEHLYRGDNGFKTDNAVESHSMGDLDDQDLLPGEQDGKDNTIQITRGWHIQSQSSK